MATPQDRIHSDSRSLDTRAQIIEAAHSRFRHYGYGKTTMIEIASDIDMSAANLYRYFKNKQEIIEACANVNLCARIDRLREVIRQSKASASDKLKLYVLTDLKISHEMAENDKKIYELINTITQKCPELVYQKVEAENNLIGEILNDGNESGEFQINDIPSTANTIHTMLVVFTVPIFMHLYSLDEFKKKANAMVDLIVNGLRSES